MISFDLRDRVAVITGGAGVLCSVLAEEMAQMGVRCAIVDIVEEKAKEVAARIREAGGEAEGFGCDVLDKKYVEACCDEVLAQFHKVDILINGAGGNMPMATTGSDNLFFDLPVDAIKWVFDLNLLGTVLPTQVFGKLFAEQDRGCVVNFSSMSAFTPLTRTLAYSGAKAAITNFTQWMATHFNQEYSKNIRVNAVAPGFLHTRQNHYLLFDEIGNQTHRGKQIIDHTPMGRYGRPEELVGAVVFLCSDAASFVNGVVLPIDGAFLAYSI